MSEPAPNEDNEPCYYCNHVAHAGSPLCPGIRIDALSHENGALTAELSRLRVAAIASCDEYESGESSLAPERTESAAEQSEKSVQAPSGGQPQETAPAADLLLGLERAAGDLKLWIRSITIDDIKHTAPMLVLGSTLLAITGRGTDHEIFIEGSDLHIDHDDLIHLQGGEVFYTTPQVEGWVPSPNRLVEKRNLIFILTVPASPLLPGLERAAEICVQEIDDWGFGGQEAGRMAARKCANRCLAEISRLNGEGSDHE